MNSTWFAAFKEVWRGGRVRGKPSLKFAVLVGAIFLPLIVGLEYFSAQERNSGEVPPVAPLIKATGYFERKVKLLKGRETGYSVFHSTQGQTYITEFYFEFKNEEEWVESHPKKNVYLEGFILRNGSGSFFATYVKPEDELPLLRPEEAMAYLYERRSFSDYYGFMYAWLFFFVFINIYNLQNAEDPFGY